MCSAVMKSMPLFGEGIHAVFRHGNPCRFSGIPYRFSAWNSMPFFNMPKDTICDCCIVAILHRRHPNQPATDTPWDTERHIIPTPTRAYLCNLHQSHHFLHLFETKQQYVAPTLPLQLNLRDICMGNYPAASIGQGGRDGPLGRRWGGTGSCPTGERAHAPAAATRCHEA